MSSIYSYLGALTRKHRDSSRSKDATRIDATRQPGTLDPGLAPLEHLPSHVLLLILDFIKDENLDPLRTIARLSSTSRVLRDIAQYVQYHTLHIDIESRNARSRLVFLSNNLMLSGVRISKVGGRPNSELKMEYDGMKLDFSWEV